jgi:rubrerythrin
MSTSDNLQAAFAGESQANRKYLAFAEKAEKEGFAQVAKLFRAAAAAETIHAHAHLRTMKGVESTAANLKAAVAGENYEHTSMYPAFIAEAEAEGNRAALTVFNFANEAEKVHEALFTGALAAIEGGADLAAQEIWVCSVCGHTVQGTAPEKCPICGAPHTKYAEVA